MAVYVPRGINPQKENASVALDAAGNPITPYTPLDQLPELVSVVAAAQWLAVRPCSIYGLLAGGGLPRVPVGRRLRIPRIALAAMAQGESPLLNRGRRGGAR